MSVGCVVVIAEADPMKLDINAEGGGGLIGCLRPALRAAGVDWSGEPSTTATPPSSGRVLAAL